MTNAVKISQQAVCLAPNPPPILGLITLIFDFGISKALLKTLQEADLISYRASVKTTGNDIFIRIHLKNASNVELTQFKRPYVSM